MNKRIKELAKQSQMVFWPTDREVIELMTDIDIEQFAELIVEECVKVCADRGTHHDGLYSAWADDCSKRIGKHFGVEEK
jgi:hypothetical protein